VQRIAAVPTFNTQFDTGPIPGDWESLIMQRVLYDPDPDSAPGRIKEKESVQGQGHAAGAHQFLALQIKAGVEFYFEEVELSSLPTFDPTAEEKKAGFGH
jgi:hypothetical protein